MIDQDTRTAILRLALQKNSIRKIAKALGVARNTVSGVIRSQSADVPTIVRAELAQEHEAVIRDLHGRCKGNFVRVHQELEKQGVMIAYTTLTDFARRHGIGVTPKQRVGRYHFDPGQEMQHDTSPHDAEMLDGTVMRVHSASLVLCYSRRIYAQAFLKWTRFSVKIFLTDALKEFEGAAAKCMLDNSTVILSGGTGKNAIVSDEMIEFGKRFGFEFVAHVLGDKNRSARVERPFNVIENNFFAGRKFADITDLNAQLAVWCATENARPRRSLGNMSHHELYAAEKSSLKPLPIFIPEPTRIWFRTVDAEGFVNLHTNRYSVDDDLIGHKLRVYESKDRVRIKGKNFTCEHVRRENGKRERVTLEAHERKARWRLQREEKPSLPEEAELKQASSELDEMVCALKKRHAGRAVYAIKKLHQMWLEYPTAAINKALRRALDHQLFDLDRIERLILKNVGEDYFRLSGYDDNDTT